MSQTDQILRRLKRGPATPIELLQELGVYRVAARVYDLRRRGYDIVTDRVGEAQMARYRLRGAK